MSAEIALNGVIDTHVHTSPDAVPRLLDDMAMAHAARDAGYAAIVLKSHHVSTAGRAQLVNEMIGDLHVLGGLALNYHSAGGLNPLAVEVTAALGGRIIWMPTFTAASHVSQPKADTASALRALGDVAGAGIGILDEAGEVNDATHQVLEVIATEDLTLATGHLSATEIMKLVPVARGQGVQRVIVTHPEMPCVGLDVTAQSELAQIGGIWFERVYVMTLPPFRGTLEEIAHAVRVVGPNSTILATDLGQPNNPHPVAGMHDYLIGMQKLGISGQDVHAMTRTNPGLALAL